ncbi:MAG TPA: amidohydrolase family protein [Actinomycetota bacterium]|nr:amidohydrolase family protein [Actinomycetota bacterium]
MDLVIANAIVVDGTGAPGAPGWVAVEGDRIASVGRDGDAPPAARTIDARGLVMTPGFVDVHNHSDLSPFVLPTMPSTIRQGVTSVVVGNCGSSPFPLSSWAEGLSLAYAGGSTDHPPPSWAAWGDYLDAIDAARPAVNIATLVGHGSVRRAVLADERRPPTDDELAWMRGLVREAIADGAVGLSTGLIYVPGIYAETDEVIALARAAAGAGGLYASHIRGEGRDLFRAIDEALEIGAGAEAPVHISHIKCETSMLWGRAGELLARLRDAPDATGDQYPYEAWNSSLSSLLPPWAPAGRIAEVAAVDHARLRAAVELGEQDFQSSVDGVGWDRIILETAPEPRWRGASVAIVAEDLGVEPFDAMVELLAADPEISCIGHAMSPQDVREILADRDVFVASDASATAPDGPGGELPVHPRDYGTFPRAIALARDEGLLPLEDVVRKMTSLPADRFGLTGRGRIEPGTYADLVVFEHATIRDGATFEDPHVFPDGISAVVVNGEVAWTSDAPFITCAGRALRRA